MTDNSIDTAIETCEEKIKLHRSKANSFIRYILITLTFFAILQMLTFYFNASNQNKIGNFIDELNSVTRKVETDIKSNEDLYSEIDDYSYRLAYLRRISPRTSSLSFSSYDDVDSIMKKFYLIKDTLAKKETKFDSVTNNLRKLPFTLQSSLFKIDNTATYIFYGIFILVFGVLTSFYRFHLKEVSKFEHFSFGFQRIRIAGNNSKTGFDDDVKSSLTQDAFTFEPKSIITKNKKIESPIPGHPTSDAFTFLMNKILSSVEITAKPKDSAKSTNED